MTTGFDDTEILAALMVLTSFQDTTEETTTDDLVLDAQAFLSVG